MELTGKDHVSAAGSHFELVKAFVHALMENGGDGSITAYLGSPKLQRDIARQILGGPWAIHDEALLVEMDWSKHLGHLEADAKAAGLSISGGVFQGHSKTAKTIFTDRKMAQRFEGKEACRYKILHAPDCKASELESLLATKGSYNKLLPVEERELFAFARLHFRFPSYPFPAFKLIATGARTDDGSYPCFERANLSWLGMGAGKNDVVPRNAFLLFRCPEEV